MTTSGHKVVDATVDTEWTKLYSISPWVVELPSVDDVSEVVRVPVMLSIVPLPLNTYTSTSFNKENGRECFVRLRGIRLSLVTQGESSLLDEETGARDDTNGRECWDRIIGTPPAWFANIWDQGMRLDATEGQNSALASHFNKASVYITKEAWDENWMRGI